ncbi:hypothetical protein [Planctomyces sp. SH-PL62]|uniref:hypothetical protein n=1 Tax=Planctomyces sp. SH-PL62 TaxID=1636152 RepID=UPI0012E7FF88|nr:hypothetical protein [Planctomyces sp. SH-PL62]
MTWADGPPDHDGGRRDAPSAIVHDLAVGKTFAPEARPTRLLLDRKARLWLGGDYGE